eukprot:IDg4123t1
MAPTAGNFKQSLTLRQKKLILDEYKKRKNAGGNTNQTALAMWAKDSLRLCNAPNQSTISRIPLLRLEDALYRWICTQNNKGVMLNGELVKMYGQKLLDEANKVLPDSEKIKLTFSKGWIERFKKRFGLRFRRVHGEAASADMDAIEHQMPRIQRLIMTFSARDTWNADEFGLFYRQPPCWTLSNGVVSGQKKEKTRMTFLACCNGDGSEKMKLMVIGTARNPRPFKKKSGQDLGFDYHANKKAWMNTPLFYAWLIRFDNFIDRKPGRKVLLMIDNCSAHGKRETLPPLRNVRVDFLPPNTTSKVQPLDAGIIAWIKAKYKRRLLLRVFDNIDMGRKSIYNVDILCAMRWTDFEWNACPGSVIKNCFDHCLKQGVRKTEEERGIATSSTVDSMERDATENGVAFTRAGLENLLNAEEEDDVTEDPTLEDLGREVAGQNDEVLSEAEPDEMAEEEHLSVEQELLCLAQARSILERHGALSDEG